MILRKIIRFWNEQTQVKINKAVYLRFPILNWVKSQIYEFWYDYLSQKKEFEFFPLDAPKN